MCYRYWLLGSFDVDEHLLNLFLCHVVEQVRPAIAIIASLFQGLAIAVVHSAIHTWAQSRGKCHMVIPKELFSFSFKIQVGHPLFSRVFKVRWHPFFPRDVPHLVGVICFSVVGWT